jgi:DNA/RNA endonuclease YhcR with UshA esterase domain
VAYALVGGATNLQVVLWDRFVPAASRSSMVEGAEVEITGLVKAFKDQLEIVPKSPDGIAVQSGAPAP